MRKSIGNGAVKRRAQGGGTTRPAPRDRRHSLPGAQPNYVLEGPQAVAAVLDGECVRVIDGYHASTDEKVLFVAHRQACDAAMAIIACQNQGLMKSKLDAMGPEMAATVYALTICTPEMQN